MGTDIIFCYVIDGKTQYHTCFKLSAYPSQLWYSQSEIPDGNGPNDFDPRYLFAYLEWLKKIEFLVDKVPEFYLNLNENRGMNLEDLRLEINEDIVKTKEAINKFHLLKLQGIKSRISVG